MVDVMLRKLCRGYRKRFQISMHNRSWDSSVKFGVCVPNYGETSSVEALRTVALEAEKLGYSSVWTTDHILLPPQSGTPYERILETITSLAYLAAITSTVQLGISSLIVAMRNPVVAVKQLATVDQLSGGRVILATSSGWNEREFAHLGSNFHNRGSRVDESIKLLRTLWSDQEPKFEGTTIPQRFSKVVFEPRPIQKHLTIWIGGTSKAAMKRAITLGDAWHPNVTPLDTFKKMVAEFRSIPGAEHKDICVRIGLNAKAQKQDYVGAQGDHRFMLSGDMKANKEAIAQLEKLGVKQMVLVPSPEGKTSVADQVESLRLLAENTVRHSEYIA
jgi:probable F420-dependent oxidoreductase